MEAFCLLQYSKIKMMNNTAQPAPRKDLGGGFRRPQLTDRDGKVVTKISDMMSEIPGGQGMLKGFLPEDHQDS